MFNFEKKILLFIDKNKQEFCFIAITLFFLVLRLSMFKFQSNDYKNYLNPWYEQIAHMGGLNALKEQVGNYSVPYQFLIALFTYIPVNNIYLYKIISVVFDFVLAFYAAKLCREINSKINFTIVYGVFLGIPTIFLNSALWGQVDSFYSSLCVVAIYELLKSRYLRSFIFLGMALSLKLQTIFILPAFLFIYIVKKEFSIFNFMISVVVVYICNIPGFIYGRNLMTPITVYMHQSKEYNELNLGYPNFVSFFSTRIVYDESNLTNMFRRMFVLLTFAILVLIYSMLLMKFNTWGKQELLLIFIITSWTCVLFLPGMHDRYGYLVDVLLLVASLTIAKKFLVPTTIMIFSSFYAYMAYLLSMEFNIKVISLFVVLAYIYNLVITVDFLSQKMIAKNIEVGQ